MKTAGCKLSSQSVSNRFKLLKEKLKGVMLGSYRKNTSITASLALQSQAGKTQTMESFQIVCLVGCGAQTKRSDAETATSSHTCTFSQKEKKLH